MKPIRFNFTEVNFDGEELQSRKEYVKKTSQMIESETRDLIAKIKGQSLSDIEKRALIKNSINILLNSL